MDMENVAYSEDYMVFRKKYELVFNPDFYMSEKSVILTDKYILLKKYYSGQFDYFIHGTENYLMINNGNTLYKYRNLNNDTEFCTIINHKNGNDYMIFRSELYGYSVLNLKSLEDFHYVPSKSFRFIEGKNFAGETFIWVRVNYNKINDTMAVGGCYWASTFGTMLLNFSEPMTLPKRLIDIQDKIPDGYDKYEDVDFEAWDDTDLVLCGWNYETKQKE